MNKFFKILGLILIIVGSAMASFTSIAVTQYAGIAVAALGLATAIVGVWKDAPKKTWKEVVTIICFALGGLLCGFAGLTEGIVTQVIMAVSGLVVLIVGIITSIVSSKSTVDKKE